ncbi:MAG: T9SS type A sorting domain-containing protein, partial [Bacteroidota bacterium]
SMIKHLLSVVLTMALFSFASGQVTTFPYVENFDSFPVSATSSPTAEPNPDNNLFGAGWSNEIAGDGPQDWYGWSGATPSAGTGPAGDHTSGSGVYMYVEDSFGANNDTVILQSPVFGINSLSNPRMAVWVHSNEADGGLDSQENHIFVEVRVGPTWIRLDSIPHVGPNWTEYQYDLSNFSGFIQFRFWVDNNNADSSSITFTHDIAIDDFSVIDVPQFEISMNSASGALSSPAGYTLVPASQNPAYELTASIRNSGLSTLTDVEVTTDWGTFMDTVKLDSIQVDDDSTVTFGNMFMPSGSGTSIGNFEVTVAENDTTPLNNVENFSIPDTVFANTDSTFTGAIGLTGPGLLGVRYDLTVRDTLSSISFLLPPGFVANQVGDTLAAFLFGYGNDLPNEPDTSSIIAGLVAWEITGLGWHTLEVPCGVILDSGSYFIALLQPTSNNLGLGNNGNFARPGYTFIGNGSNRWFELGTSAFMIQMNFGPVDAFQLTADKTAVCDGDTVTLMGSSSTATYSWMPGMQTTQMIRVAPTMSTTYTLTGTMPNGCVYEDSLSLAPSPNPNVTAPADTSICDGESVSLTAVSPTMGSYVWSNGDPTATIVVSPMAITSYIVSLTDMNGCIGEDTVTVTVDPLPTVTSTATDLECNGDMSGAIDLDVAGGAPMYMYMWSNGEMTEDISGLMAGSYNVTVTDANGCSESDTVTITEPTAIMTMVTPYRATFGQTNGAAKATPSGGTPPYTYMWDDPSMATTDSISGLAPGTYTVVVTDGNGCTDTMDVVIEETPVSIDGMLDESLIGLYPNPSAGTFTLDNLTRLSEFAPVQVQLFNAAGERVVSKQTLGGQNSLTLTLQDNFSDGLYMILLSAEGQHVQKRVLIVR